MTIRNKVFAYIILFFTVLIIVAALSFRFSVLKNLEKMEQSETVLHMEGIKGLIEKDLVLIDSMTVDWASWDDTYEFIVDRNQDYIESNILPGTLYDLGLDIMVYIDSAGEIVFAWAYDAEADDLTELPEILYEFFSDNAYPQENPEDGLSGFLVLDGVLPLILSSRPILPSNEDAPSRGQLIFGRYLTPDRVNEYDVYSNSSIYLYTSLDDELPEDVRPIISMQSEEHCMIMVRLLDEDIIAGYGLCRDITNRSSFVFQLQVPREIYKEGVRGVQVMLISLTVMGFIVILISLVFADKVGLGRLKTMTQQVEEIGKQGNIQMRVRDEGKDELGVLGSTIDTMLDTLQELYDKEAELSHKLELEMNRRTDFMRALVHELRTPLTPILTTSEMLLDEVSDELDRTMIENIYRGAIRLNKRITELLDFSRGEVGGLEIDITDIDPNTLLWEAYEELKPEVEKRKKTLELNVLSDLPMIRGDEDRIKQVLSNLIDNAIKYSVREDTIIVSAGIENDNLVVSVRDHGPGISPENLEHLFDPYYRVNKKQASVGGLGLGLPLCRNIVELHNGTIEVESHPGEGSVFTFMLPLNDPYRSQENESTGN